MLGCHLIEFHCEIKSEEQCSWAETRSFLDHNRSTRTVELDRFCAGPLSIGPTKTCSEIAFRSSWLAPLTLKGPRLLASTHNVALFGWNGETAPRQP